MATLPEKSLTGASIGSTYKDLLTVKGTANNEGLETTLKTVVDGEGTESAIQLSTTTLKVPLGKTLDIDGTFTATALDIGGGHGGSGVTLTTLGAVSCDSTLTCDDDAVIAQTVHCNELKVGGGYGDDGLTIDSDGDITMDGNGTVFGDWKVQGTVIADNGKMKKAASGAGKAGITVFEPNEISLTVEKESVDVELLKIDNNGVLIIKDDLGDSKFSLDTNGGLALKSGFEAKSTGPIKLKSKTTTELNAITGTAGELAYNSTKGKVQIWIVP